MSVRIGIGQWERAWEDTYAKAQALQAENAQLREQLADATHYCSGDWPCEASTHAASLERERNELAANLGQYTVALSRIATEHLFYHDSVNGTGQYSIGVTDGHRCAAAIALKALGEDAD